MKVKHKYFMGDEHNDEVAKFIEEIGESNFIALTSISGKGVIHNSYEARKPPLLWWGRNCLCSYSKIYLNFLILIKGFCTYMSNS